MPSPADRAQDALDALRAHVEAITEPERSAAVAHLDAATAHLDAVETWLVAHADRTAREQRMAEAAAEAARLAEQEAAEV